jgi:hypothetical protein
LADAGTNKNTAFASGTTTDAECGMDFNKEQRNG